MSTNPYTPPTATVADVNSDESLVYAGFWVRVGAAFIDSILIIALTAPLLFLVYGKPYFLDDGRSWIAGPADFTISYLLPAAATVVFWLTKQATPGKMAFGARVVDARTGGKLTTGQSVIRYLGYYVSLIPFGLGILWVAFDRRKQGWHDKLAGTVVVRRATSGKVTFDGA